MPVIQSHSESSRLARCGIGLTVCCALLAASTVSAQDSDGRDPAIPAGQERIMAAMLGRGTLIRDCRFVGGSVDYTVIRATYNCPREQVTLELDHLLNATADSTQTGQFAITVLSGSPPPGFQESLLSRIRSRETGFVWTWPETAPLQDDAGDDGAE
jgi:hypothetical protein